MAKMDN